MGKMRMLYIIILIPVLTGMSILATAQPTWQWAKSAGGNNSEEGNAISTDVNGNVLVTGRFSSASITFGTITLTNNHVGEGNFFVVKYDASGNVLWAKSAGGQSDDGGNDITTDADGNVFVAGYFSSASIVFGTTILTNTNTGTGDIFVLKYDASGNVLWAKSAGGGSYDFGAGISTDASGNVLLTGVFYSVSITFGATTLTNVAAGNGDMYVAKYNASGNVLWAKSAGGFDFDGGNRISTDASGNVFVTGGFSSDSITFGTNKLTNAGIVTYDFFIVKYDASGNVLWAQSAGTDDYDEGLGISTDASGNVLVTGYFTSASITFGTTTITNAGFGDIFIVKYNPSGNVLWAKSVGGDSDDYGFGNSADASGNVVVTGYFFSPTITFGATTLTNAGLSDIFVVKYNTSGNVLWAKSAGGIDWEAGRDISTGVSGNVLVTGYFFSPTLSLDTTTLTNANPNWNDFFVADLINNCDQNINEWIGIISTAWEVPGNWSCGVIPGPQTNVFLNSGTVVVSSNVEIRSLTCNSAMDFIITPGSNFIINH